MRYHHLRDPLFLACVGLYFFNRFLLKPLVPHGFHVNQLNDLICIPFWVPIMLYTEHKLGLREASAGPQWYEILLPLVLWSLIFELLLPQVPAFHKLATTDCNDIVCYAVGALVAAVFWRWRYPKDQLTVQ